MPIDRCVKAVNLIPSEQRASGKSGKSAVATKRSGAPDAGTPVGAYAILGFLVMCIAAAALYVTTSNSIKDKEAELAQVEQEATAVEAQAASLQSFADFQQLADAREATVTALASSRFAWPATLDDISRALPSDVFLSSLDGSTTAATGGSSLRGAIQAPSIELNGCTTDQASVARLMSNLREVRGVTRVTLAKSEALDTVSTAAAPAPATAADGEVASVTTEPCPAGSPPAFTMIAFFERAALSAAASPNAAVPTGAAAGPTGAAGAVSSATTPPADPATTTTTSTTP